MKRFDAVFFDFDGVLIISEPIWWSVIEEVLRNEGVVSDDYVIKRVNGLRLDAVISRFIPDDKQLATSIENKVRELAKPRIVQKQLTDGAKEAIHDIFHAGIMLGVVSSSPMDLLVAVLEANGIYHCFSVLIGGDSVERGKPAPDGYRLAATSAEVATSRCCAVEDSKNGIKAARAAKMHVVRFAAAETGDEGTDSFGRRVVNRLRIVRDIILRRRFAKSFRDVTDIILGPRCSGSSPKRLPPQ